MKEKVSMTTRRDMLNALLLSGLAGTPRLFADEARPKHILLRSSWQTVNIGDIAHTPGVLRIIERELPDVEVTLWPMKLDNGVDEILRRRFPRLRIATTKQEVTNAFDECDFLLHGSGANFVSERGVRRWKAETAKPYGVYGITLPSDKRSAMQRSNMGNFKETIELLSQASFVFFRDSRSLAFAKESGCSSPIMQFGPDGAFGCDLRNDEAATKFLQANDLQKGKFLCCIPRLRFTPYWVLSSKKRPFDRVRDKRNREMASKDHQVLVEAITQVVQQTDMKILLCPEDQTQMQVGKQHVWDQLPESALERVVWKPTYWLTGEAVVTYIQSAGLFGFEMHSPIMCIGHGVPAIVCRWAEQTTKGYMWEDIGLSDWLFDMDDPNQVARVVPTVLEMAKNPVAAKEKAAKAQARVLDLQAETMQILNEQLDRS
ncbi:Polysaccharide pyruvyl transferase [Crateriforma conspicua]|uniref:Polysaccharide pyruvyl transferase n=1 Tax=Crateriforma conspicua TaxID=2527996 RepID=A0A5C6FKC1_9PLAN|nr:polysaccharide pyruvyl transferase family protein [Crateriforma conspicua]TWU62560.1 Polysaccharide pyruvyl transferase [Crateriforma conspicua]